MRDVIYESDPNAAPDDEYVIGEMRHAVAGNHGRLRDVWRTPLSITSVEPERGEIELRIEAFEDRGATWRLPVWEINHIQFPNGSRCASSDEVAALARAAERFDRPLRVEADPAAGADTRDRITHSRQAARKKLIGAASALDLAELVNAREGHAGLTAMVEEFLGERGPARARSAVLRGDGHQPACRGARERSRNLASRARVVPVLRHGGPRPSAVLRRPEP